MELFKVIVDNGFLNSWTISHGRQFSQQCKRKGPCCLQVGWGGIIGKKKLANPSLVKIWKTNRLFQLVARILYLVIKCPTTSCQRIFVGSKKDFIYGWKIHEKGVVSNCFDFMFTKWLMQRKTLILDGLLQEHVCMWHAPKSLVEPTWGFNCVELRKVGTWGPLPTSSTIEG